MSIMEQTFDRQEALRALRVAIRSVRRTPIRIPFGDDDRFFIEIRIPRFAERLDLQMAAELFLGGYESSERLLRSLPTIITAFRLPAEDDDGNFVQAIYNTEPLPDLPVINLTPTELFSDDSAFNATPALMTVIITTLMTLSGRTQAVAAGVNALLELFPGANQNSADLLEQGSSGMPGDQ
jgi:hypothetical protein